MYTRLYTTEQYLPSVRAAASSFSLSVNQVRPSPYVRLDHT